MFLAGLDPQSTRPALFHTATGAWLGFAVPTSGCHLDPAIHPAHFTSYSRGQAVLAFVINHS